MEIVLLSITPPCSIKTPIYRILSAKSDMNFAGLPATIVLGAISFVTIDPAATDEACFDLLDYNHDRPTF